MQTKLKLKDFLFSFIIYCGDKKLTNIVSIELSLSLML